MNNLSKYFIFPILFVLLSLTVTLNAQSIQDSTNTQDTIKTHKFNMFGYPYAFYSPETQLAFGAGGIATFYLGKEKILRPSKVTLSGYYTTNGQYSFNLNPQFYFAANKYFFSMPIKYSYDVDKYYGVGNTSPEIENSEYTANIFSVALDFQIPAISHITNFSNFTYKSGILFDYKYFKIADRKTNPYLNNDSLNLKGGNTLGLGMIWVWDSRNSIFFPTRGGYHQVSAQFFMKAIGSDYDFNIYIVDLRRYIPIVGVNTIGLQVYGKFVRGYPPFYELAALGGQNLMRGYYQGRFRDKNYITAQIEYRAYLWWKIGIVVFLGAGGVNNSLSEIRFKQTKFSYGFGLRYQFDKEQKVNLRVDVGFGKETSGVYFGIEEAF